jgi:pyruvate kinase
MWDEDNDTILGKGMLSMMRKTKIVATYGPACESERVLRGMFDAGLDVLRLNLSHLDPAKLPETVRRVRGIATAAKRPVAILADMPGPKIRCTACEPEHFELYEGGEIRVAAGSAVSTLETIHIPYRWLIEDVKKGHELAINDGMVLLHVEEVNRKKEHLRCRVVRGGIVASRKGVSFLHTTLRIPGLTPRDRAGLRAAAEAQVDFVALSFVRSGKDVIQARKIIDAAGGGDIPLIAKIEQHEAIDHIDDILAESDGVMVARGDMGIERPLEEVPILQKEIIRRCNLAGKPVITATQMLESMTENALPTRAEVSDVANAILDGTDAVMLSAETAMGRAPVQVVRTMARIAETSEVLLDRREWLRKIRPTEGVAEGKRPDLDDTVAYAACQLALDSGLDAVVCLSYHGTTARRVSRYRPGCPVFVLCPEDRQARRLALHWGVEIVPFPEDMLDPTDSAEELLPHAAKALCATKRLRRGQHVVFLAGVPFGSGKGTNWVRVVEL